VVCPNNLTCASGACACRTGETLCGSGSSRRCVDARNDPANCGACGNVCPAGRACSGGTCVLSCPSPQVACNSSCVDTRQDPDNCGTCGLACPSYPNGTRACSNGTCVPGACNSGFGNCNNNSSDGCEANLLSSTSNCGTCGTVCSTPANAVAGCLGGTCGVGACNTNFGNCNNSAGDGCEIDLRSSNAHCGACNRACTGGTTCQNGVCTGVRPCSQVARDHCIAIFGSGATFVRSFPSQQITGGICLLGASEGSNCNACNSWRFIAWRTGYDNYDCANHTAGRTYCGHMPCTCGDNQPSPTTWDLQGCTPD
jgi:hypothetical protein